MDETGEDQGEQDAVDVEHESRPRAKLTLCWIHRG